jgi:sporulation protein YlmC with PRC-barrel domain
MTMLKHSLAAGLLACAALTPAAFAQDAQTSQQKEGSAAQDSIKFIRSIEGEQFRSTNLVGKTVYNLQDENIGDISDLIVDSKGRVAGVIVGVGGFLGMGQSEVAVPMNALKFEPDDAPSAASGATGTDKDATGSVSSAPADANVEKQPGSAGQPSGSSTSAALPSQNTKDEGTADKNAAAGADQAKQDPAQAGPDAKSAAAASGDQQMETKTSTAAETGAASDANSADADWLANMKVVVNTTRQDLTDAPKFGEEETSNPEGGDKAQQK